MRERARLLGGQLDAESSNGHGTRIILRAPIKATVKERNRRLRGSRP
jgi:nitrate/nitrite-specific signal transduction histidine kinase